MPVSAVTEKLAPPQFRGGTGRLGQDEAVSTLYQPARSTSEREITAKMQQTDVEFGVVLSKMLMASGGNLILKARYFRQLRVSRMPHRPANCGSRVAPRRTKSNDSVASLLLLLLENETMADKGKHERRVPQVGLLVCCEDLEPVFLQQPGAGDIVSLGYG